MEFHQALRSETTAVVLVALALGALRAQVVEPVASTDRGAVAL